MRRRDREITDTAQIERILGEAEVLHLAMYDGSEPYIAALNYAYSDGCLYMHCALEGRKVDILRKNGRVAFQAETGVELVLKEEASQCTTRYKSVVGTGTAVLVDDREEKIKALDLLMIKHSGKAGAPYPEKALEKTLVIKVIVDSMTGKKSGYEE